MAENEDRFWRIRPLYDTIRSKCRELYLDPDLCIDKRNIPIRGQLNVK